MNAEADYGADESGRGLSPEAHEMHEHIASLESEVLFLRRACTHRQDEIQHGVQDRSKIECELAMLRQTCEVQAASEAEERMKLFSEIESLRNLCQEEEARSMSANAERSRLVSEIERLRHVCCEFEERAESVTQAHTKLVSEMEHLRRVSQEAEKTAMAATEPKDLQAQDGKAAGALPECAVQCGEADEVARTLCKSQAKNVYLCGILAEFAELRGDAERNAREWEQREVGWTDRVKDLSEQCRKAEESCRLLREKDGVSIRRLNVLETERDGLRRDAESGAKAWREKEREWARQLDGLQREVRVAVHDKRAMEEAAAFLMIPSHQVSVFPFCKNPNLPQF